jgi:hypothetical protein
MSILSSYGNEILVSYARGGESEHMVDELEQAFVSHGIHIVRDIKELGYKGSLEAFKRRIGRGQCIILVISDGYLRSENCMYELVEVHKNKHLRERIFPIVLAEAQIYKPIGRLNYIKHWDKQIEELNHAIKDVEIVSNLSGITADLDKYTIIRASFDHLTDLLSDMYTLTSESHQANGFSTLIDAVKNAMGMTSSVSLPDISDGSGAPPNVEQPLKTYYSDLMENKEFLAEFGRRRDLRFSLVPAAALFPLLELDQLRQSDSRTYEQQRQLFALRQANILNIQAAVQGSDEDKRKAFFKAYTELHRRISLFINLPFDKLSGLALKEKLDEIGRT